MLWLTFFIDSEKASLMFWYLKIFKSIWPRELKMCVLMIRIPADHSFLLSFPLFLSSIEQPSRPLYLPTIDLSMYRSIYHPSPISSVHLYIHQFFFWSEQNSFSKSIFFILFYRYKIFALCNSLEVTCSTYNIGVPLLLMHFGDYFGTDWSPDLAGGGALREFVI